MKDVQTTPARIRIVEYPNPDCRDYGVTKRLHDSRWAIDFEMGEYCRSEDDEIPPPSVVDLAVALSAIVGVEAVSVGAFELNIVKATAFDWSEIEPAIIGCITRMTFADRPVEIDRRPMTYCDDY